MYCFKNECIYLLTGIRTFYYGSLKYFQTHCRTGTFQLGGPNPAIAAPVPKKTIQPGPVHMHVHNPC